jgi:hypothetical protein
MGKRKAPTAESSHKRKPTTSSPEIKKHVIKKPIMNPEVEMLSPSSKITVFKLDVITCNGGDLRQVELAAPDLENIWEEGILRDLTELAGYTSIKVKNNTEIRIQYQLKKPMSIRDIALDAEFNFERSSAKGVEILRCRVVGLSNLRQAEIGEKVKVSVIKLNFDLAPEQIIEWLSFFGRVHDGHR